MKVSDSLLPEFDPEMANTRKVLERVPAAKFSWKPHPKSSEFGALAAHLANMPDWAGLTMQSDSFDYAPPGAPPYETPKFSSTDQLVAAFDKSVAEARASLVAADDAKFLAPWTLKAGGKALMTMPRVAVHLRDEPHHSPSRSTGRVFALKRYPGTGALRSHGGRTVAALKHVREATLQVPEE